MFTNFAIFGIGTPELLLILGIIVLLFGAKKLPELSRSIGESFQEIKKGASAAAEVKQEVQSQVDEVKSQFVSNKKSSPSYRD